jgi:glycosyltransferase involved in cell wall biosynthesis
VDEVTYGEKFYADHKKGPTGAAYRLGRAIWNLYHPESAVDVGCAVGVMLRGIMDASLTGGHILPTVIGIEALSSKDDILKAGPEIPVDRYLWVDLETYVPPLPRADVVVCTEVGEHLPQNRAGSLVAYVASTGDRVVWSAAIPGQGGDHHVNEQPEEYWEELFRGQGFLWDREETRTLRETLGPTDAEPWFGRVRVYRKHTPSTTIIVRTFNDADFIPGLYKNLGELKPVGRTEILIGLDAGSTDRTRDGVEVWFRDWSVPGVPAPPVTILTVKHRHVTPLGAFHLLAEMCRDDDFVIILDADNRLHPDRLTRMHQLCPAPEGVCACAIRRVHPDGSPDAIPIIPVPGASFSYRNMIENGNQLDGLCLRINGKYLRERILPILREVGDEDLPEDQIITLVASYDGLLHAHPNEVLADYTVRPDALSERRRVGPVSDRAIERVRSILERPAMVPIPGPVLRRHEGFRATILHLHYDPEKHPDPDANPTEVARARQKPTWDFIHAHRKELSEVGITIEDVKVGPSLRWGGDLDRAIRSHWWDPVDVLGTWEPDVVPASVDQVLWVMSGEWPWAGARMRINRCLQTHLSSDNPDEPVSKGGVMEAFVCYAHQFGHDAFRVLIDGDPRAGRWAQPAEEWADLAPLGLTSFRRDMRYRVGANWAPVDWNWTDTSISNFLSSHGYRCRRVGPYVTHNHVARGDHDYILFSDGRKLPVVTLDDLHPVALKHILSLPKVRQTYEAAGVPLPEGS